MPATTLPSLGFGLGLRPQHYPYIFEHQPGIDWFEIISENFMDTDGRPKRNLERILERYPVVMHGVSLSIGTVDPLNSAYLRKLKALIRFAKPLWISDHLCWTGVAHQNTHDLLPVPYTEQALRHVVRRIREVQDFLEQPIALENPSTYLEFRASHMPEAEFIARMVADSGCNLLLDVNNVYVTCFNHRLDAHAYLDALPMERVIQIHLAGHAHKGTHIIDTHDDHVTDEVWLLYRYVLQRAGRVPNTMVEWDDQIPDFPVLQAELHKAKQMADSAGHQHLSRSATLSSQQPPQTAAAASACDLGTMQQHMLQAITQGERFDSEPISWIRDKQDFAPQEQLNVYVNAYRWRLQDVVAEDYPVLKHYLGEDDFNALIAAFVEREVPSHFNIGRFALQLPAFIRSFRPNDVFAHELCELETAVAQLADPEESPALTEADVHKLTPVQLLSAVLVPRTALQLQTSRFAVNEYYGSVMDEAALASPVSRATWLVIYRHDDRVWRMELEQLEYQLLESLISGLPVGVALEHLQAYEPAMNSSVELTTHISHWFSRWMRNGVLSRVKAQSQQTMPMYTHTV